MILKQFFFGLFFIFLVSSLTRNFLDYRKNLSFYEDFKKEYQKEKTKNTQLKTDILKSSDPNQVEKVIRNKLNLLKPNEVAIIIPNPTPTVITPTPTLPPPYEEWLGTFLKN